MAGTIKVLLLAADHKNESGSRGLRLDHEIRKAVEAARMGRGGHELELVAELAAGPDDLVPAILRHQPAIVHFAGHGNGRGLVFDRGTLVPTDALVALFRTYRGAHTVVLNACETFPVAKALSKVVDYAVAMETMVSDPAAIAFAGAFYATLAFGHPVPDAFGMGEVGMKASAAGAPAIARLCIRPGAAQRHAARAKAVAAEPEKGPEPTDGLLQVATVTDTEADGPAEVKNKARGLAAGGSRQEAGVSGSRIRGPLQVGNTIE